MGLNNGVVRNRVLCIILVEEYDEVSAVVPRKHKLTEILVAKARLCTVLVVAQERKFF